jgi:transposase
MTAGPCASGWRHAAPSPSSRRRYRKTLYDYDREAYRQRNVIERMFCRLKDWRRIATRYDRKLKTFLGALALAAVVIWWL